MNLQGREKQERRGVKTSYPVTTSGSTGMQELTFIFKTGKWGKQESEDFKEEKEVQSS